RRAQRAAQEAVRRFLWQRGRARPLRLVANPPAAAALAALVYCAFAIAHSHGFHLSPFPYFNWLADGFLHGQLSLRGTPPQTHDLIEYGGNWYLYWPPFPAVVLMPWVALFGPNKVSDIALTAVLGAVNVG